MVEERFALTQQNQTASHWAAQYSGVFASSFTGELMFADAKETISVVPFESSPLLDGAPIFNRDESRWYNGATFDASDVVTSFAVQWDAKHPLHVGREGLFEYWGYLFGGNLNPPPPAP